MILLLFSSSSLNPCGHLKQSWKQRQENILFILADHKHSSKLVEETACVMVNSPTVPARRYYGYIKLQSWSLKAKQNYKLLYRNTNDSYETTIIQEKETN